MRNTAMGDDLKLGMARISTPRCPICHEGGTVIVQMSDFLLWTSKNPPLIQNCFPSLSADLREQILTGTHPACWAMMFPPEEEEEFGEDEVFPIRQGEPPLEDVPFDQLSDEDKKHFADGWLNFPEM